MPQSEDDVDLDGVLQEIGQFGLFQMKQYGLMVLPIIFNALFTLSYIFTAGNLEYRLACPWKDNFPRKAKPCVCLSFADV